MPDLPSLRDILSAPATGAASGSRWLTDLLRQAASTGEAPTENLPPPRAVVEQPQMQGPQQQSLEGTMTTPAAGGGGGRRSLRKLPQGQSVEQVLNKVQETTAMMSRANEEAAKDPPEVISKWNPATNQTTYEIKNLPQSDMQDVFQALQFTREAMKGYHQEFERLGQQEKQLSTGFGPIGNLLATLGGNLAIADPRLPPVVRALGMTSKQLNPTLDEVRNRKLGVASEMADISQRQETIYGAVESRREAAFQREQAQDLRVRTQEERERQNDIENQRKAEKAEMDQGNKLLNQLNKGVKEFGEEAGKAYTDQEVAAHAQALGITNPAIIDAAIIQHRAFAREIRQGVEYDQANKKSVLDYRANITRENNIQAYLLKDKLAERNDVRKRNDMQFASDLKKQAGLELVPKKDLTDLAGLHTTEKFLDGIDDLINNPTYAKYAGIAGAIGKHIPAYLKSTDQATFESYLAHELPRILEIVGRGQAGGFSMMRSPKGIETINRLGVMPEMRPAQQKAVLAILRQITKESRGSITLKTPVAQWEQYKGLLGKDYEYAMGQLGRGTPAAAPGPAMPQFSTPGAPAGAAPPQAPANPLDAGFLVWQQQQR